MIHFCMSRAWHEVWYIMILRLLNGNNMSLFHPSPQCSFFGGDFYWTYPISASSSREQWTMRSHGEQLWRFCYSLWESSMSGLLSLSASHTKQGCVRGTTPNTIEGIPQFGRLEMLIPVISNIWEWPFKKRLSVDLD